MNEFLEKLTKIFKKDPGLEKVVDVEKAKVLDVASLAESSAVVQQGNRGFELSISDTPHYNVLKRFNIPGSLVFYLNVGINLRLFVYKTWIGFSIGFY